MEHLPMTHYINPTSPPRLVNKTSADISCLSFDLVNGLSLSSRFEIWSIYAWRYHNNSFNRVTSTAVGNGKTLLRRSRLRRHVAIWFSFSSTIPMFLNSI